MINVSLEETEWNSILTLCATHLINSHPVLGKVALQIATAKAGAAAPDFKAMMSNGGIERIVAAAPEGASG